MHFTNRKAIPALLLLTPLLFTACGAGSGGGEGGSASSGGAPATPAGIPRTPSASTSVATRAYAYAADDFASTVSGYSIDSATGELTLLGTVEAGSLPKTVSVHPGGRFLYVANTSEAGLSTYLIDPATGALSLLDAIRPEGAWPPVFAVEGKFLLMANNFGHDANPFPPPQVPQSISTFAIDSGSGALTLGSTLVIGRFIFDMVAPPGTNVAYFTAESPRSLVACTIDPVTGSLNRVAEVAVGAAFAGFKIAAHPGGKYAYAQTSDQVIAYRLDSAAGTLTQVGVPVPSGVVAVHPGGNFVYVESSTAISIYRVDAASGALVPTGASAPPSNAGPFVFDPSGTFAYIGSNSIQAYSVDLATGTLTPVGIPVARSNRALSIATAGVN